MTPLTKTAILVRKIIRYSFFAIVGIIVARGLILTSYRAFRYFVPKPPPPPTLGFGKLPTLPFPKRDPVDGVTYTLETPDGSLPNLTTQLRVYFMPKLSPNLLSYDGAKERAELLGYSKTGQPVSETVYNFNHEKEPSVLKMNTVTGAFSISYDLTKDKTPIERIPPAPEVAAGKVREFLSAGNSLPEDLTGPMSPEFIKFSGGNLVSALSLSDSNLVKINLYRKSFEEYPSLPPNPFEANIWFMIAGTRESEKEIIAAEYHYYPVDETRFETYPIKSAAAAWEELKQGGGFMANFGKNDNKQIVIRRVYLAYFDPNIGTEFLQPIIVFEGDNNFFAYVPAASPEFYGE